MPDRAQRGVPRLLLTTVMAFGLALLLEVTLEWIGVAIYCALVVGWVAWCWHVIFGTRRGRLRRDGEDGREEHYCGRPGV